MDVQLFDTASKHDIPAAIMADTSKSGAVTTRWKYYRMDPKAFMQMGILKVRFFMEFLRAGFDLLCSDLDVVWLRDPRPFLVGDAGTSLLPLADVVVSTDVTNGGQERDDLNWGLNGELNTGIILMRSSKGSLALCDEWIRRMQDEMINRPPPSGGFLQWWSNDQTFFNEVVHRAQPMMALGSGFKSLIQAQRESAAALALKAAAPGSARTTMFERAIAAGEAVVAAATGSSYRGRKELAELRNLQLKRMTCHLCADHTVLLTIGTLPYLQFASGHTFFTQSLQERNGFRAPARQRVEPCRARLRSAQL